MQTAYARAGFLSFCVAVLSPCQMALSQEAAPAVAANPTPQATALAYVAAGSGKAASGDLTGALDSFNEALKLDPQCAPAFESRGRIEMLQHQLEPALSDFNKAEEINPSYQEAFYYSGVTKGMQADFDGAVTDFDTVIKMNANYAQAFYNRGHARYFKGDMQGALSDTSQAILLDHTDNFSHFIRGLARRAQGDREGAVADLQISADSGYAYAAFWLWLTQNENANHGEATQALNIFLPKSQLPQPDPFALTLGNFLLGRATQDDLLAQLKSGDQSQDETSGAWYFIGMVKRMAGDEKGAGEAFKQVLASNEKDAEAYVEANRELAKLAPQ